MEHGGKITNLGSGILPQNADQCALKVSREAESTDRTRIYLLVVVSIFV